MNKSISFFRNSSRYKGLQNLSRELKGRLGSPASDRAPAFLPASYMKLMENLNSLASF